MVLDLAAHRLVLALDGIIERFGDGEYISLGPSMQQVMPKVSVVLTAYRAEAYVEAAVRSVLLQTEPDFELIAVNDGSPDATGAVLDSIGDPRLRVIHQENQGPAGSLNTGLRLARGEFIALLDGDDIFVDDKIRRQVHHLEIHPEADLTFTWSDWIDARGLPIGLGSRHCHGSFSFEDLLEDFVIGNTSSVLFRRSCLDQSGLVDSAFSRFYDVDLFLRIALLRSRNVHCVAAPLTLYRRHPHQMSRNWKAMEQEWHRFLKKMQNLAPARARQSLARGASNMQRYFAFLAYEAGEPQTAARILAASIRSSPVPFVTDLRNWKVVAATAAALVLPSAVHSALERLAGVKRASV